MPRFLNQSTSLKIPIKFLYKFFHLSRDLYKLNRPFYLLKLISLIFVFIIIIILYISWSWATC